MRKNILHSRKLRYGGLSVGLTALIIAIVLMLNAGLTALSDRYGLYIDMTYRELYTLSDDCRQLLAENFEQTAKAREDFNANLPAFNLSVAETNLARLDTTLSLAEKNISVAEKNAALAERNRQLLAKSINIAEDNIEKAEINLTLTKSFYDYAVAKEGESSENAALAASAIKVAEENLAIAEANAVTAAENRLSASGYKALALFKEMPVVETYKYLGTYEVFVEDTDTAVAAKNIEIAAENKTIAAENRAIAAENVEIARKNMTAGATPDAAGYTPLKALKPYVEFEPFSSYLSIADSETPRTYESYLETESESNLFGEMKVKIIFCDDRDAIYESTSQRYVLETAEDLQREFPEVVEVEFVNIWKNPSAVQKYKGSTLTNIYSTNVIIESGTEWRVQSINSFFTFDQDDSSKVLAYSGEKKMASAILAVIKAESPIACVTINHGEIFTDTELLYLIQDSGYTVQFINLATEEIPEDCRLLVVYNPTSDFLVKDKVSDVSEIAKINSWLDEFNSMMVFMSPDSPTLPNFEEYLEEWGIVFDRHTDALTGETSPYMIKDSANSLTADGMTVLADYTTAGLGSSIHKDMRSVLSPAKISFKNAMSISYGDNYEVVDNIDTEDPANNYRYGSYYSNGVSRQITDIFVSKPSAIAMAGGEQVAAASDIDPFKLMTITREAHQITNDDYDYSYVIACGSTEFASAANLNSNALGNAEVLVQTMRVISRETVVVDLGIKFFDVTNIETLTTAQANQYTVILTVVPAVVALGLGVFVVVRRRYS